MKNVDPQANLIILTRGTKGDLYPFIHVGREFKKIGCDVSLLSTNEYMEYATREGFTYGCLEVGGNNRRTKIESPEFYNTLPSLLNLYREHIIPNLVHEFGVIENNIGDVTTTILAHGNYYFSAMMVREKYGVPLYLGITSPSFVNSFLLFEGILNSLSEEVNEVRELLGLPRIKNWKKWLNAYSACIAFWPEWYSSEATKVLKDVKYSGFLSHHGLEEHSPSRDIGEFLSDDDLSILITHGTSRPFNDEYFKLAIGACAELNCRLIISTPFDELLPNPLPNNVLWVKYYPFEELLALVDLIIHHGGIGTIREAIANSVPQLIIGQGFDRQDNGKIVKALGVGDLILPKELSLERIYKVVDHLLCDQSTRNTCIRYSSLLKNQVASDQFYQELFAAFKKAAPISDDNFYVGDVEGWPVDSNSIAQKLGSFSGNESSMLTKKVILTNGFKALSQKKQALFLKMLKRNAKVNECDEKTISLTVKYAGTELSSAQLRIWGLVEFDPKNPVLRAVKAYEFRGALDVEKLKKSFLFVIKEQEMLRTYFVSSGREPKQLLEKMVSFSIAQSDLRGLGESEQNSLLISLVREDGSRSFDLASAPLMYLRLISLDDNRHILVITGHLLITDAFSMDIIFNRMRDIYLNLIDDSESASDGISVQSMDQHADYVHWQKQLFKSKAIETQKQYWQRHLAAIRGAFEFPRSAVKPDLSHQSGAFIRFSLGRRLSESLKSLAQIESVSSFMFLLTAYNILCSRFSGQSDILLGCPVSNRRKKDWHLLVGNFSNMLILRNDLSDCMTVRDVLSLIKRNTLDAFSNQDVAFEDIADITASTSSDKHAARIKNTFGFHSGDSSLADWGNTKIELFNCDTGIAKYETEIYIWEEQGVFDAYLIYDAGLFKAADIEQISQSLICIIDGMVSDINANVADLAIDIQDTSSDGARNRSEFEANSLYHVFAAGLEENANRVAIVDSSHEINFHDMNLMVNQLADSLGRARNEKIALCLEHSVDYVVALLALSKLGQDFVVISPDCSLEELNKILESYQLNTVIAQPWLFEFLKWPEGTKQLIFSVSEGIYPEKCFTSEEHKDQKSCLIVCGERERSGLIDLVEFSERDLIECAQKLHSMTNVVGQGKVPLHLPIDTKQSLVEIALSCIVGESLLVNDPEVDRGLAYWKNFFETHSLSYLFISFEEFELFQSCLYRKELALPDSLSTLFVRGGPQTIHLIDETLWVKLKVVQLKFLPHTLYKFYKNIENNHNLSVWMPIDEKNVRVANEAGSPCPINVAGYIHCEDNWGWKKTPVFARKTSMQEWEIFDSVKSLNGWTIFPQEVENFLRAAAHDRVRYILVRAYQRGFAAYIIPVNPDDRHIVDILYQYSSEKFPSTQIPNSFQLVGEIPFSENGSDILWDSMPDPALYKRVLVPPSSEEEKIIRGIWHYILGVPAEEISIDDNFFGLGGHSLLLIKLVEKVNDVFSCRLDMQNVFAELTIENLAKHVSLKKKLLDNSSFIAEMDAKDLDELTF